MTGLLYSWVTPTNEVRIRSSKPLVDGDRGQHCPKYTAWKATCSALWSNVPEIKLWNKTRSSATALRETAIQGHRCVSRRGVHVYDFLLALSSNLTSIFNRSWDITPNLHAHATSHFQVELEKDCCSRWTCFGVRLPRTLDYPTS